MELRFAPLFSGSSGNAIYVGTDRTNLLIDAGVSGSRVLDELKTVGVNPSDLDGILVTHEHSDHIKGVGVLARKLRVPIYATEGTWAGMEAKLGKISLNQQAIIQTESPFYIGDLDITAFPTPHDALEPCGFAFSNGCARFAIATDIGYAREGWMKYILGADAVFWRQITIRICSRQGRIRLNSKSVFFRARDICRTMMRAQWLRSWFNPARSRLFSGI